MVAFDLCVFFLLVREQRGPKCPHHLPMLAHSETQNCPIYFLELTQRANEIICRVYKSNLKRKCKEIV